MAKTEESPLSVILGALAQGVGKLPVEIEKQKTVRAQNAFQNFTMQRQMQQQQMQQQESMLDQQMKKLQMQEANERIRQLAMKNSLTPEMAAKIDTQALVGQVEALKPLGLMPTGVKPIAAEGGMDFGIPGFDKLSAPTRDVALLFGVDEAKKYVNDSRTNTALSEKAYTEYLEKVRTRNDAKNKANSEIQYKNQLVGNNPKLVRPISDLEPELSYEDWRAKQEQLLGITPQAALDELRNRGKVK